MNFTRLESLIFLVLASVLLAIANGDIPAAILTSTSTSTAKPSANISTVVSVTSPSESPVTVTVTNTTVKITQGSAERTKRQFKFKLTNSSSTSRFPDTIQHEGSAERLKRQLYREHIPHHRPLSGNIYADHHGFPHPGRWFEAQKIKQANANSGHHFESPNVIITDEDFNKYGSTLRHIDDHRIQTNPQPIVHEYPVQVSNVIPIGGASTGHGQGNVGQNYQEYGPPAVVQHGIVELQPYQPYGPPATVNHGSTGHGQAYQEYGPPTTVHHGNAGQSYQEYGPPPATSAVNHGGYGYSHMTRGTHAPSIGHGKGGGHGHGSTVGNGHGHVSTVGNGHGHGSSVGHGHTVTHSHQAPVTHFHHYGPPQPQRSKGHRVKYPFFSGGQGHGQRGHRPRFNPPYTKNPWSPSSGRFGGSGSQHYHQQNTAHQGSYSWGIDF